MRQVLFHLPVVGLPIFGYGFMLFLAFLGSMNLAAWRARREKLDPELVYDLALWMFVGGLLGARTFYVWQYWGVRIHGILDVFEANVAAMAEMLRGTGKTVRPHMKTHRTPELARRQLGGPITGVTCATVGEAEAMVAAGITDVLIANEVVDPAKLARVAALAREARVTIAADDAGPVTELSRAAMQAGVTVNVLVDVDTPADLSAARARIRSGK